jgi:hypothetical protein
MDGALFELLCLIEQGVVIVASDTEKVNKVGGDDDDHHGRQL